MTLQELQAAGIVFTLRHTGGSCYSVSETTPLSVRDTTATPALFQVDCVEVRKNGEIAQVHFKGKSYWVPADTSFRFIPGIRRNTG